MMKKDENTKGSKCYIHASLVRALLSPPESSVDQISSLPSFRGALAVLLVFVSKPVSDFAEQLLHIPQAFFVCFDVGQKLIRI